MGFIVFLGVVVGGFEYFVVVLLGFCGFCVFFRGVVLLGFCFLFRVCFIFFPGQDRGRGRGVRMRTRLQCRAAMVPPLVTVADPLGRPIMSLLLFVRLFGGVFFFVCSGSGVTGGKAYAALLRCRAQTVRPLTVGEPDVMLLLVIHLVFLFLCLR